MNTFHTPDARARFLAALRRMPIVAHACRAAGVTRSTAYALRARDPEFAKHWEEAIAEGIEWLEAEAHRRAFEGVDKPVTHKGEITDWYKEYSDTLAIFLLKAHAPEKYRERTDITSGGRPLPAPVAPEQLPDLDRELRQRLLPAPADPEVVDAEVVDDGSDLV